VAVRRGVVVTFAGAQLLDVGGPTAAGYRQACTSITDPADNPEHLAAAAAFAGMASLGPLGELPMVVATAEQHRRPGLDPATAAELDRTWSAGRERWASASSAARLVPIAQRGHDIQFEQPGIVVDLIESPVAGASPTVGQVVAGSLGG
jgi:hypothetical protein